MQSEFLMLDDYMDQTCPTSILHPKQLLNNIIDIKQIGSNTRKIYQPDLPDNARVYTYNFDTHQVEIDIILAVEHVVGEFDEYLLKSFKTAPVKLTNYNHIKTNQSRFEPNPKFTKCNRLGNYSNLLLQVINYNNISNVEDVAIIASNDASEIEIPMTNDIGFFIGCWLGNGSIKQYNNSVFVELVTTNIRHTDMILNIIETDLPESSQVTTVRHNGKKTIISINDELLASWLKASHDVLEYKQLPSAYYSAPYEFIYGLLQGLIESAGRVSINSSKRITYCTIASQSSMLIAQVIELLSLYLSIPASKSKFKMINSEKFLYIVNIRITDQVKTLLKFEIANENLKYVPNANISYLNGYSDIVTIMRPKLDLIGKTNETFMFRLKTNNNIIGMNGLIYKCHIGLRL